MNNINKLFYYWLSLSFVLVFLMIIVGGLTRLTDLRVYQLPNGSYLVVFFLLWINLNGINILHCIKKYLSINF